MKNLTNEMKSYTDNKDILNSDIQKFSTELFQDYTQKSFDAINAVYAQANASFIALTKITSPEDFYRYIQNMSHITTADVKNFNENAINSFFNIASKYSSWVKNDGEQLQNKVQPTLNKEPKIGVSNTTAKADQKSEPASIPVPAELMVQVPLETMSQVPSKTAVPNSANKSLNSTKTKPN